MWSGPRNLSTAMMYSFGNRPDCAVWDEPFYAAYLAETGLDHPMREEIIAAGPETAADAAALCAGDPPNGRSIFYQKHMTQHILPGFPRAWFDDVTHVFLIRHPARVLASYDRKRENPGLDDIGFRQQAEIFAEVRGLGGPALVIDSADIRNSPEAMLRALCDGFDITFDPAMLSWPAGGHSGDGVWAAHWYDAVHRSTGFAGPEGDLPDLSRPLQAVCTQALPFYETLLEHAMRPV
ncbi:HAD family hydrolase [Algicella marina]|uniref:HAD family hydrolase n=1 Tax=Algicella marina TaxID=2683284 RepID=A0A6P1T6E4_9RHOB|nr:HAD family hydrolase [Algicella marina]QHQ37273.1 HAD family hydrolase [Algicella marina]